LPENKEARIIDVACGAGHFLYFLQQEGYTNTQGIDLSEEQLEVAGKMGVGNLQKIDIFEYLPRYSQEFDFIIANDIIEHLNKDEVLKFLDIIYASLKIDGKALISAPNAQALLGAGKVFIDFTHEQGFTPGSLSQVLCVCNFKDVKIYGEKPVVHDFKSAIRTGLWSGVKKILKFYSAIESGTGRGLWKYPVIFEPRIFAIGKKI
jgi:cyclopropane fatty-acyl-phospholipid synthase-like methyltransferase